MCCGEEEAEWCGVMLEGGDFVQKFKYSSESEVVVRRVRKVPDCIHQPEDRQKQHGSCAIRNGVMMRSHSHRSS